MPGYALALFAWAHVVGVALAVGGLLQLGLATLPAVATLPPPAREDAARQALGRTRKWLFAAVALLLVTGLLRWMPYTGGVGWKGHGGIRTGFLHAKIFLALVFFHFSVSAAKPARAADPEAAARRALWTAVLGFAIMLLAFLSQWGL